MLINPDPIEQEIPYLYPSCAVTRAMAMKAKINHGMHDIDLTDTLIGQSFNDEISNFLSSSMSVIQTDIDTSRSSTDLSPSISNDQGHDQLSRSQLCIEQHSDPEISPLFERALDENEKFQVPVCYYVKNDILMRKWRPPGPHFTKLLTSAKFVCVRIGSAKFLSTFCDCFTNAFVRKPAENVASANSQLLSNVERLTLTRESQTFAHLLIN